MRGHASSSICRRRHPISPARKPIRLLLVDDHEVVRVGLRTVLHNRQGITVVGEAGSKAAAVQAVKRLKPDIVLMDVRLPDGSGVEASRDIFAGHPATRIIFLTSYMNGDSARAAMLAGAQGYVVKNIDSGRLIRSIHDVSNGQSMFDPALAQQTLSRNVESVKARPEREPSLAPQEERVLALLAEGFTNKEIAVALGLSDKTVKNYIANMFQKLNVSRRAQAAAYFVRRQV
jgi:two-component system, NarL family, response regulator DevR